MNALSILYSADQLTHKITPTVPQEVQQLANQFGDQAQQALNDFAYYGLLIAGLTAAIALLFSSLLLVLNNPQTKLAQPELRLIRSASVFQPSKRPVENRIARANRNELRLVSDRVRAGQFSN